MPALLILLEVVAFLVLLAGIAWGLFALFRVRRDPDAKIARGLKPLWIALGVYAALIAVVLLGWVLFLRGAFEDLGFR